MTFKKAHSISFKTSSSFFRPREAEDPSSSKAPEKTSQFCGVYSPYSENVVHYMGSSRMENNFLKDFQAEEHPFASKAFSRGSMVLPFDFDKKSKEENRKRREPSDKKLQQSENINDYSFQRRNKSK